MDHPNPGREITEEVVLVSQGERTWYFYQFVVIDMPLSKEALKENQKDLATGCEV